MQEIKSLDEQIDMIENLSLLVVKCPHLSRSFKQYYRSLRCVYLGVNQSVNKEFYLTEWSKVQKLNFQKNFNTVNLEIFKSCQYDQPA